MNLHNPASRQQTAASTMHIGILETGQNRDQFVERHGTFADWFMRWLGGAGRGLFSFSTFQVCDDDIPDRTDVCDAYVITGSAASVTEQADWMKRTQAFACDAAEDRPVVGFCFGHQLLADAYGGTVEQSHRGWGVGIHTYDIHEHRSWMTPASGQVAVVASHMDQVVEPPRTADVLAGSSFCPIGMLQIGDNALTFQNHPEITKAFARELYNARTETLGIGLATEALDSLSEGTHSNIMGNWVASFLLR